MNKQADNQVVIRSGMGLADVVFVVFLVLKLIGVINWSWWWITAPLWGQIVLGIAIVLLVFIISWIIVLFEMIFHK